MDKKTLLCTVCFVYIVFYISTISLWNSLFGSLNVFRLFFYAIILAFSILPFFIKKITSIHLVFGLYCVYCLFSLLIGGYKGNYLDILQSYILMPLLFFGITFLLKYVKPIILIKVLVFFGAILSVFAFFEFSTGMFFMGVTHGSYLSNGMTMYRSRVFADNDLTFGCQLAVSSILSAGLFLKEKNKKRFFWLILFLLSFAAMLTTGARGPMVGCIVGCVVLLFPYFVIKKKKILFCLFLLLLVISVALLLFALSNGALKSIFDSYPLLNRIISTFDWSKDLGNLGRLAKWNYYITIFLQEPVFGHGVLFVDNSTMGVTESGLIQRLVEIGLIGYLLYLLFILLIVIRSFKDFKKLSISNRIIVLSAICAAIAIFVEDLVLQVFTSTIVNVLLWSCLAISYYIGLKK